MKIADQITQNLIEAQKAKQERKVMTLRGLKSELKNKEIELGNPLSDADVVKIVQSEAKKRKDAIDQYGEANRPELVKDEKEELSILEQYLPQQLSDDQINELIDQAIAETKADSISQMGSVMSAVMPKIAGQADGAKVSQLVKQKLGEK